MDIHFLFDQLGLLGRWRRFGTRNRHLEQLSSRRIQHSCPSMRSWMRQNGVWWTKPSIQPATSSGPSPCIRSQIGSPPIRSLPKTSKSFSAILPERHPLERNTAFTYSALVHTVIRCIWGGGAVGPLPGVVWAVHPTPWWKCLASCLKRRFFVSKSYSCYWMIKVFWKFRLNLFLIPIHSYRLR